MHTYMLNVRRMRASRYILTLLICLCVMSFGASMFMWFTEDSRTYTDSEAFYTFLHDPFDFQVSPWFCFASGFMLCTAILFWRLLRLRHEPYA